jgi:hypothetical protein
MARVGFEPTIPVFKRAKTVHALDRATTVIGSDEDYRPHTRINSAFVLRNRIFTDDLNHNYRSQLFSSRESAKFEF